MTTRFRHTAVLGLLSVLAIAATALGSPAHAETNPAPPIPGRYAWAPPGTLEEVTRIAGANRYATAAEVAERARAALGKEHPFVYVASGEKFPDGLTGGAAAAKSGGVLLLTQRDAVPPEILQKLREWSPPSIFLVGGEGSISTAVENELCSLAPECRRVKGETRYHTAAKLATGLFPPEVQDIEVVISPGDSFAAPLRGAAQAAFTKQPILLLGEGPDADPAVEFLAQRTERQVWLTGLLPRDSLQRVVEVVSPTAPIEPNAPTTTNDEAEASAVQWTAVEMLQADHVLVASADEFADGLAAGPLVSAAKTPLILSHQTCAPVRLQQRIERGEITRLVLLGGPKALDIWDEETRTLQVCSEA